MLTEVLGALLAGLVAGVLHVLSGPDHLAAVLPFAVRGRRQALRVGATWGLGHGLGVLLLGAVAIALRSAVDVEAISAAAEVVVGVMLMVLGAWAIRRSRLVQVHAHEHAHEHAYDTHHVHGDAHTHGPAQGHVHTHDVASLSSGPAEPTPPGASTAARGRASTGARTGHHLVRTSHVHVHVHVGAGHEQHEHPHSILGFGVVHGLAGAGHLLGVLPSLAMGPHAAMAYLGAFLVGGLAAMSAFAFLAGRVVLRDAWVPRALRLAGATTMAIGAAWVVTSTGLVTG